MAGTWVRKMRAMFVSQATFDSEEKFWTIAAQLTTPATPMTATNDGGRIVDGATRLYCIIGDPVAQTGSPRVFSARFRAAGRNALLVPFHVPGAAFEPTVRGIMALANLDGIIVTVPYKARMLPFVDRVLATAQKVGAVNA